MKNNKTIKDSSTALDITRITRTVYFIVGFYLLSIVIFDAGNLLTREAVIDRWTLATFLLVINTIVWLSSSLRKNIRTWQSLSAVLVTLALLTFAGLTTYWERGMASTSTIFYVLPILTIAILKNRHAILATATLSVGTYAFAGVKYFNDFFNEGYRVQLWGHLVLYTGVIFASAWLVLIIANLRHDSR